MKIDRCLFTMIVKPDDLDVLADNIIEIGKGQGGFISLDRIYPGDHVLVSRYPFSDAVLELEVKVNDATKYANGFDNTNELDATVSRNVAQKLGLDQAGDVIYMIKKLKWEDKHA